MTPHLEAQLDRLGQKVDAVHADVAAIRAEVRILSTETRNHEQRDTDRFAAVHSDIRELRDVLRGVEDTSRHQIVTTAQASALETRRHEWRRVVVGSLVALALAVITFLAGRAFGAQPETTTTMETEIITSAIESGRAAPIIGVTFIVLSWALHRFRHGEPITAQLRHAGTIALGALPWSLSAAGLALVAGAGALSTAATAITVLLVQAGFTLPKKDAPAKKIGPVTLVLLASLAMAPVVSGCATLTKVLNHASRWANYVTSVVDAIEAELERAELDDSERKRAAKAIQTTRSSIRALHAASSVAEADQIGDVEARERAVVEAFRELHAIASQLGLLSLGGDDVSGAAVPTPDELEARLQ